MILCTISMVYERKNMRLFLFLLYLCTDFFCTDLLADLVDKRCERFDALIAHKPASDRYCTISLLLLSDNKHIRQLAQSRFTDLVSDLLGTAVNSDILSEIGSTRTCSGHSHVGNFPA